MQEAAATCQRAREVGQPGTWADEGRVPGLPALITGVCWDVEEWRGDFSSARAFWGLSMTIRSQSEDHGEWGDENTQGLIPSQCPPQHGAWGAAGCVPGLQGLSQRPAICRCSGHLLRGEMRNARGGRTLPTTSGEGKPAACRAGGQSHSTGRKQV